MKINKSDLKCFIFLLIFFEPVYFGINTIISKLYEALFIVETCYLGFAFIKKCQKNNKKLYKITGAIILLEIWFVICTILNSRNVFFALKYIRYILLVALILEYYSSNIKQLIRMLLLHSELCIYTNLITLILYPNGLFSRIADGYGITREWFLGAYNGFIIWLYLGLMVAWIYKAIFKDKKRCYLLTIAIVITEIIKGSSTGIVGVVGLLLLLVFPNVKKIITPTRGIIGALIVFFSIVVFNNAGYLEPIVVDVLGKNMTFTGRLTIWKNAINAILSSPIFGYGILNMKETASILGRTNYGVLWEGATHCHCQILQIGFMGGFVGLGIYSYIYYLSLKECVKLWKYEIAQICTYSIIIFTIISITEVFEYPQMYIVLIFPFYMKKICEREKNNEDKNEDERTLLKNE